MKNILELYYEEKQESGGAMIREAQTDIGEMQSMKDIILRERLFSDDEREEIINLIREIQFYDNQITSMGRAYAKQASVDLANIRKRLEETGRD